MNSDKIQVKEHPKEHKEITDYINFFLSLDFISIAFQLMLFICQKS